MIYRHPNNDIHSLTHSLSETLHYLSNSKLPFLICGDININLLQQDTMLSVSKYVDTYNSYNCLELITVTTEPSDERNLSPGFVQLRTPARINICSVTQQPPGTKLNKRPGKAKECNSTRHAINGVITVIGNRGHQNCHKY